MAVLLISQSLDWLAGCGDDRGYKRADKSCENRPNDDIDCCMPVNLVWDFSEHECLHLPERCPRNPANPVVNGIDVVNEEIPADDSNSRPYEPYDHAVAKEYPCYAHSRATYRFEDSDILRLLQNDHVEDYKYQEHRYY